MTDGNWFQCYESPYPAVFSHVPTPTPAFVVLDQTTTQQPIQFQIAEPTRFVIFGNGQGEEIITISLETGQVTVNPKYSPDVASKAFWALVRANFGQPCPTPPPCPTPRGKK